MQNDLLQCTLLKFRDQRRNKSSCRSKHL